MKSTGIVKSIDKLGRFKIPKELRKSLNIRQNDSLALHCKTRNQLSIAKVEDKCIFCNSSKNIHIYKNKNVCQACVLNIKSIFH